MGGCRGPGVAHTLGLLMELLIRVVDKGPGVDQSKAGDVIAICPDGWAWSQHELTNPEWVIVKSALTQIEADALLSTDVIEVQGPKRRRKFTVNVAAFTRSGKNVLAAAAMRSRMDLKP